MIINIAALIIALVLTFRVVRYLWMISQAKQAIRADLAARRIAPLDIRRMSVWRNCGSISAAFWLLVLDYEVSYKDKDDQEAKLWYSIDFAPLMGRIRALQLHN